MKIFMIYLLTYLLMRRLRRCWFSKKSILDNEFLRMLKWIIMLWLPLTNLKGVFEYSNVSNYGKLVTSCINIEISKLQPKLARRQLNGKKVNNPKREFLYKGMQQVHKIYDWVCVFYIRIFTCMSYNLVLWIDQILLLPFW